MSSHENTMKTRILAAAVILLSPVMLVAQSVDSMFVDARGSFMQHVRGRDYSSVLTPDYLNLHMYGTISPKFSFRIRQRFNVGIDAKNPFRATDWMCLNWQAGERLRLYAGKTAILIGGFEYDSAPIDVYFYSNFCSNLAQYFAFSTGGQYEIVPGQNLAFQISNSPLSPGFDDKYAYNIAWIGGFAPWWKTIWSSNIVEDEYSRRIHYLALGNHCVWGGLAVDLDFINRASFRQDRFFLSDWSTILKVIWSVGKWNICGKIGYEMNDIRNADSEGRPFDTVVPLGSDYIYGGVGLEYFPLGNDRIRFHIASYSDSSTKISSISTGVKWRFDIISR